MDEKKISELRGKEIAFVPQSTLYLDPLMKVGKQVCGKEGKRGQKSNRNCSAGMVCLRKRKRNILSSVLEE